MHARFCEGEREEVNLHACKSCQMEERKDAICCHMSRPRGATCPEPRDPKIQNFCPELPFNMNNMKMKSVFSNGLPISK